MQELGKTEKGQTTAFKEQFLHVPYPHPQKNRNGTHLRANDALRLAVIPQPFPLKTQDPTASRDIKVSVAIMAQDKEHSTNLGRGHLPK